MIKLHSIQFRRMPFALCLLLVLEVFAMPAKASVKALWASTGQPPATGYVDQPMTANASGYPMLVYVSTGTTGLSYPVAEPIFISLNANGHVASGVTPTLSCGASPGCVQSGPTEVYATSDTSGYAAFSGLIISAAATGYTLKTSLSANPGVNGGANSATFDVMSQTKIMALYAPTSAQPGYSTFTQFVVPHVDGAITEMKWSNVDTGGPGGTGCQEANCNWTSIDNAISGFAALTNDQGENLKVGILVWPIDDNGQQTGGNTVTPAYLYSTGYANWASTASPYQSYFGGSSAPQDSVVCANFQGGDTVTGVTSAPVFVNGGNNICSSVPASGGPGVWNVNQCWASSGECIGSAPFTQTAGLPIVYELPFMTAYANFIAQVIKHYSPSGGGAALASSIAYIRFGMDEGAEALPFCTQNWPAQTGGWSAMSPPTGTFSETGYLQGIPGSVAGYTYTIDAAIQHALETYNPNLPIVQSALDPNPPSNLHGIYYHHFSDTEAMLAASFGIGVGDESMMMNDAISYANTGTDGYIYNASLSTGDGTCQEDWCAHAVTSFDANSGPNGQYTGPQLYIQTAPPSSGSTIFDLSSLMSSMGATYATADCDTTCQFNTTVYGHPFFGYDTIFGSSNTSFNQSFLYNSADLNCTSVTQIGFTFGVSGDFPSTSASSGAIYVPDFVPITFPFATNLHVTSLETNMCDLYYAYAPGQSTFGSTLCPTSVAGTATGSSAAYANALSSISGK